MQRGKLRQAEEDSIRKNYVDLKENIEARELVDYLYQYKVISEVDKELIQEGKSKSERNEHLLQAILNSGPGDAFRTFIHTLRKKKYNHLKLVQEYLSQDVENTEPFSTTAKDNPDATPLRQMKRYDLTVLLVGESGCGKSSTYKTLLNLKSVADNPKPTFQNSNTSTREFNGRKIQVVDSPKIINNVRNAQRLIDDAKNAIESVSDGFHAFLVIIKYSLIINNLDLTVVETLKLLYGPDIIKNYCILIITHGDLLLEENTDFEEWCSRQEGMFKQLYEECGLRAVLVDNNSNDVNKQSLTLQKLLDEIDSLLFNGRRYTTDHFTKAENGRKRMLIEDLKTKILEETSAKCCLSIQISNSIETDYNNESVNKLNAIYTENLELKKKITLIDEGTNILHCSLNLVDSNITLLSEKLAAIRKKEADKKTKEIEEKRKLEKVWDEDEKKTLRQIVLLANEKISKLQKQITENEKFIALNVKRMKHCPTNPMGWSNLDKKKGNVTKQPQRNSARNNNITMMDPNFNLHAQNNKQTFLYDLKVILYYFVIVTVIIVSVILVYMYIFQCDVQAFVTKTDTQLLRDTPKEIHSF